jgi:hypothetical protein
MSQMEDELDDGKVKPRRPMRRHPNANDPTGLRGARTARLQNLSTDGGRSGDAAGWRGMLAAKAPARGKGTGFKPLDEKIGDRAD